MTVRLLLISLAALAVAALASPSGEETEAACTEARSAFYERAAARRMEGTEIRAQLITEANRLIDQHRRTAPLCTGRLHEHLAYLLVIDGQFETAAQLIQGYLPAADANGPPRTRVALRTQLGYVLNQLDRPLDASRAYFAAAERARSAPARVGAHALVEAAATARTLGDEDAFESYFRAALSLVADSVEADPRLKDTEGFALVSLSLLTESRLAQADGADRDSLVTALDRTTDRALTVLGNEGQALGLRAIAMSLSARAAAFAGRRELALSRVVESYALTRRAGSLVPMAEFEATLTESIVRGAFEEWNAAEVAAQRAAEFAIRQRSAAHEATALERLGEIAEATGRWNEASERYERAIDLRETQRLLLGLQDWSPSAFATMQAGYRGLVRVHLARGDAEAAFVALDQTRARYLQDLRHHLSLRDRLDDAGRRRVDSLTEMLSDTRLEMMGEEAADRRAALAGRISLLQSSIERETGTPLLQSERLDVGELQRTLDDESETLVAYSIDATRSTAFVVRSDTLIAVSLDVTPARLHSRLRTLGTPWNEDAVTDPAFSLATLQDLYDALVAPVRKHVTTEHVVIVPGTEVALVPFAALTSGPSEDYATAPYLVRDLAVRTELAAALVPAAPTPRTEGDEVAVFGRTDFDAGSTWNAGLPPLPHVGRETRGVTRSPRLNEQATEAAFRAEAPGAAIVHVATHTETNATRPLYSRIALVPGDGDDGTLHLFEILATPLSADLVTLSGCETAKGGARRGEGIVGLQYGMRAAGASATLATLWSVADRATADLMSRFYDGLADGLDKPEALRRAQLAHLDDAEGLAASPFFWAAPVLSGSSEPVHVSRTLSPWWLVGLVVAAAGAWLAWRQHRRLA